MPTWMIVVGVLAGWLALGFAFALPLCQAAARADRCIENALRNERGDDAA